MMCTTQNSHLGWVCALPFLLSAAWAADGAETVPAQAVVSARQAVEEIVVTETPIDANIPTVELMEATYKARQDGGRLYRLGQYEEALPLLLVAAKKGFKWEQARVSFLYQQGYGTEQDVEAAVAWLGVAARGDTTPEIRGRFKEIWARIPEQHRPHFEAIIDEYEKRYGNKAHRTFCKNRMELFGEFSKKRILECDFIESERYDGIVKPVRRDG